MPAAMKTTPVPARSSEREALAAAITQYDAATARLARVRQARAEADEVRYRASTTLTRAEAALAEAKQTEGARLAAVALGEQSDTLSVAEAEVALVQATNDHTVCRNTAAALEARETAEQRAVEAALRTRDETVSATVKASAAMRALLAAQQAANGQLATLTLVFNRLSEHGCNPLPQWGFDQRAGSTDLADQWQAAINELRTNADAELPTS